MGLFVWCRLLLLPFVVCLLSVWSSTWFQDFYWRARLSSICQPKYIGNLDKVCPIHLKIERFRAVMTISGGKSEEGGRERQRQWQWEKCMCMNVAYATDAYVLISIFVTPFIIFCIYFGLYCRPRQSQELTRNLHECLRYSLVSHFNRTTQRNLNLSLTSLVNP